MPSILMFVLVVSLACFNLYAGRAVSVYSQSQSYGVLQLEKVTIYIDSDLGKAEIYLKITGINISIQSEPVDGITDGDTIVFHWNVSLGATTSYKSFEMQIWESDYGSDDFLGSILVDWHGEALPLHSTNSTGREQDPCFTVTWSIYIIESDSPPENVLPAPYRQTRPLNIIPYMFLIAIVIVVILYLYSRSKK
ncbi:MAG: hypothetical protein ACFFD4_20575 [Candidatus Odinarchaeota archaeon]